MSHHWTCGVPGCRGCGSGYPSERAARAAARRHADTALPYHRILTARTEAAR